MKKGLLMRLLPVMLVLLVPLVASGCPAGSYYGSYDGPGYTPNPSPPFVYGTVIDLYLCVIDPIGYALPGCEVELIVNGIHHKSYVTTSGNLYPIHDEFPGEWANYNDAFSVKVNRYAGQTMRFDVIIRRWGFMTAQTTYTIPNIDRDSIYVFFDETVMYP